MPGTERPFCHDLTGRDRVGEGRFEGHAVIEGDRTHVKIVDGPYLRTLVLIARDDEELGVLRDEMIDDEARLELGSLAVVGLRGSIVPVARRYLDLKTFDRHRRHVLAHHVEDIAFDGEAPD